MYFINSFWWFVGHPNCLKFPQSAPSLRRQMFGHWVVHCTLCVTGRVRVMALHSLLSTLKLKLLTESKFKTLFFFFYCRSLSVVIDWINESLRYVCNKTNQKQMNILIKLKNRHNNTLKICPVATVKCCFPVLELFFSHLAFWN